MREEQDEIQHTHAVNSLCRVPWNQVGRETVAQVHAILLAAGVIKSD
jgi:hypothetical protein